MNIGNFHFFEKSGYTIFIISYFTSTTEYKDVQYMYGKLSLRALHTCIERDMYSNSYGVGFWQFGKKGPFLSVIIHGLTLKKKKKKNINYVSMALRDVNRHFDRRIIRT